MFTTRPCLARRIAPVLAILGLIVACTCANAGGPKPGSRKLNVLFLISDDLTASALGCYGNRQCKTPHIDRLAGRGVRFNRAYCQFPVCGPSRAALMSGMYAQVIGVTGNGAATRFTRNLGDRPALPQLFRSHGWYTARVSKIYHMRVPGDITAGVDGPDHAPSWTERFNCQGPEWMTKGEHSLPTTQKVRKIPDKHYGLGFGTAFYIVKGASDGAEQPDVQAADKAIELLARHKEEPFFLAVGLVRPHVPLVAPAGFFKPYPLGSIDLAKGVKDDQADIPRPGISLNSKRIGLEGKDDKKREVLAAYYAAVAYMDAQVGRILAALEKEGLRDNTVVVFCSDHGYHLGEHDLWQKMSLHEESARIPLIVSAPGYKPGVSDSLAEQIDLYPTLADLAGLKVPAHCQGKSLKPVLADPGKGVREAAYCLKGRAHLLRTDRWAFISYGNPGRDGPAELYDMKKDPRQFTNLAGDAGHAAVVKEMRARLAAQLTALSKR
jgi:iduronate 2-sulfatase